MYGTKTIQMNAYRRPFGVVVPAAIVPRSAMGVTVDLELRPVEETAGEGPG